MTKLVWVVGASSGIGAESVVQMAVKGWHVIASARSKDKLDALAEHENVSAIPCDVTDQVSVNTAFAHIVKDHGTPDLVLLNAGTYFNDQEDNFTAEAFKKTFDVNVYGVAHCLEPVLKAFVERGKGHVALVASVAGFRGLPRSLSYGPTKAAMINMAEALYMTYKSQGIKVQVINPGFIKTPLTDKNDFKMPMLMPVDKAVEAMIRGLESNQFEIIFPWPFVVMKKLIDMLPNKAYLWIFSRS